MKKNKGFTLIELLAVIVILAIIALIATPRILDVVETARKGAAESSVLGYIDAVEKQYMINQLDDAKADIPTGSAITVSDLRTTYGVNVSGEAPADTDTVTLATDGTVSTEANVNKFHVNKNKYEVTYTGGKWVAADYTAPSGSGNGE